MAGLTVLEELIAEGFAQIAGNPFILGLLVLVFFTVFVMLQNTRLDTKIAIIIPAIFLAMAFAPILAIPFALGITFILYLAITKALGK